MRRWGNRTQVLIGLWILTGLAVLGINGYALMSLLDEPLAGYSSGVRSADRGLREYRRLLAAEVGKITSGMDLLAQRFAPPAAAATDSPSVAATPAPSAVEQKASCPPTVALPTLAGIMTSRSSDGRINRLALLDGKLFSEGDQVQHFTVEVIAAGGVLLSRGGKTWRLPVPEIAYSLTRR